MELWRFPDISERTVPKRVLQRVPGISDAALVQTKDVLVVLFETMHDVDDTAGTELNRQIRRMLLQMISTPDNVL
jgi:hypothetical protein